ncbi:hypothetical protein BDY19DRAFT_590275 [Irpex rosettiformis]|uniref:Uncharacterized protein n=1 Tax=Irpex rosettiformis TaxID=378272 RepID=A0ACB8UD65_9APHY|nr:hypothetical protein BDY19DRAFT_590275 [Irpex rosettiformis]
MLKVDKACGEGSLRHLSNCFPSRYLCLRATSESAQQPRSPLLRVPGFHCCSPRRRSSLQHKVWLSTQGAVLLVARRRSMMMAVPL